MKYNFKTDNFKNFEVFCENLMPHRSYFIPFKSVDELMKTDMRNERYSSSMVECLSGEWDFAYFKSCKDIDREVDIDKIEFDKVSVPSTWQHTGYEEPYYVNTRYQFKPNPPHIPDDCPAAIYRRKFEIDDLTLNYTICFLGVAGGLDLFVNGKYVGYSEGSHNTAEFRLNKYLVSGENEVVVLNHKWTNGTYLECQDMFRCNGIFRDVLLYKTPATALYDFKVQTNCINSSENAEYSLIVIPSLVINEDCELTAYLYDDGELVASSSVNQSAKCANSIKFNSLNVKEWSAECPYLYELVLVLSKGGDVIEAVRRNIGFKNVKINGNVFTFNGKPIKLLGVNHHDTNPKTGYVLTIDEMERDIKTVKEFNGNCIRTSHYPPDPAFLDLCDEYGIYIVDEADIETHGCEVELHRPGACSHNEKWQRHYWDRVHRMYQRDKNHPCITMWSLGNEAHGYKNQDYCYNSLKELTDIPIHYEGVCRTRRWSYDVLSQMYTFPGIVEKIGKGSGLPAKFYKKPFYLCEYAHAMGVGAGELERYVQAFYNYDILMGGCIWEFADHAAYHKDGPYEYTYGGDHAEWKHDGNFCVDGLFYPDRTPHSGAYQMKACYRPVRARRIGDGKYAFKNHRYFVNAELQVKYRFLVDGEVKKRGTFSLDTAPQSEQIVELTGIQKDERKNCVIIFEYYDNDFLVAAEQSVLSQGKLDYTRPEGLINIKVEESEKKLFITTKYGKIIYDLKSGFFLSHMYKGKELINQSPLSSYKGFGISLYRAPLDNDMYISKAWEKLRLDSLINYTKNNSYKANGPCVEIESTLVAKSPVKINKTVVKAKYTVFSNGEIKAQYKCVASSGNLMIPRFGIQLEMPQSFNKVKYFGLGNMVNLPDFKEHALMGVYRCAVSDMHENYIKPQESATRCDTRYAEITDRSGVGLRFEAVSKPFIFSANHFTPEQCAKAMHKEDLKNMNTTCINIDAEVMGAGSNSCGPIPSKQYLLGTLIGKELSFTVKPIGD